MTNIFDLENLDDLTDEMRMNLKRRGTLKDPNSVRARILSLFELKSELTIQEVKVGFYRKFKIIPENLTAISSSLHVLTKTSYLTRTENGYKLRGAK